MASTALALLICVGAPAPSPPPPGFAAAASISTPAVDVPSEPSLSGDPGSVVANSNGTTDASDRHGGQGTACATAGHVAPAWWMNTAAATYKLLPVIGIALAVFACCICSCCCFRRHCTWPHDYPYDERSPRRRDRPPLQERQPRRPSWAIQSREWVGGLGRGIMWSERRRPMHPRHDRRRHSSTSSLDECRL